MLAAHPTAVLADHAGRHPVLGSAHAEALAGCLKLPLPPKIAEAYLVLPRLPRRRSPIRPRWRPTGSTFRRRTPIPRLCFVLRAGSCRRIRGDPLVGRTWEVTIATLVPLFDGPPVAGPRRPRNLRLHRRAHRVVLARCKLSIGKESVMASILKYLDDPKLYESTATVIRVDTSQNGDDMILMLDETIFYPRGGGQPADRGRIVCNGAKQEVIDVRYADGDVLHIGPVGSQSFEDGDRVELAVDPELRDKHSRLHTGGHLIMTAIDRLWGFPAIKGYHFPDGPYIQAQGTVPPEDRSAALASLQIELDHLVAEDSEVTWRFETIANLKAQGIFVPTDVPSGKPTRVVVTSGYQSPCGGTHVRRLGELRGLAATGLKVKQGKLQIAYNID
jgi:Ser-tRNA(Ala) deacylase AlaX